MIKTLIIAGLITLGVVIFMGDRQGDTGTPDSIIYEMPG